MKIEYRKAETEDAEMLINIYNASFYSDYRRFIEMMEASIRDNPKYIILCDNKPVGCVSCKMQEMRVYEITCLCIVPEYQGKGIGTQAVRFVKTLYEDWEKITLVTPVDKKENVKFYTEKCGFRIVSTETDGNVELARFVLEKQIFNHSQQVSISGSCSRETAYLRRGKPRCPFRRWEYSPMWGRTPHKARARAVV